MNIVKSKSHVEHIGTISYIRTFSDKNLLIDTGEVTKIKRFESSLANYAKTKFQ